MKRPSFKMISTITMFMLIMGAWVHSAYAIDDMLVYQGSASSQIPEYQSRNLSGFETEATGLDVGRPIWWAKVVADPTGADDEKVLCTLDDREDLNCQVWDGTTWGDLIEIGDLGGGDTRMTIDVAYSHLSAEAVACIRTDSSTNDGLPRCGHWDGTTWTTASASDVVQNIRTIQMVPESHSDYIAMMIKENGDDVHAQMWDGTTWGTDTELTDDTSQTDDGYSYSGDWESSSGDFIMIYYNLGSTRYDASQYHKSTGWGTTYTDIAANIATTTDLFHALCKSNPDTSSNEVICVVADDDDDLHAAVWDGSTWTDDDELVTDLRTITATNHPFYLEYENSGDYEAMLVYHDASDNEHYRIWDGTTWGAESNLPDLGASVNSDFYTLHSDPMTDDIMLVIVDSDSDVETLEWDGSTWPASYTQAEANADTFYRLAWYAYDYVDEEIYRSVGTDITELIDNASIDVDIEGTVAQFTAAINDDIGVGDALVYTVSATDYIAFIDGRTDSDTFSVQSHTGGFPQETGGNVDVSVYRSFGDMRDWEDQLIAGVNSNIDADVDDLVLYNSTDLVADDYVAQVACYADGLDSGGVVVIADFTTGAEHYIRLYTPTATTEVGDSQRHHGVYSTADGYAKTNATSDCIQIFDEYVRVEGLQCFVTGSGGFDEGIIAAPAANPAEIHISENIVVGSYSGADSDGYGIRFSSAPGAVTGYAYNNIVYDFVNGATTTMYGFRITDADWTLYLYNNTVQNCYEGIRQENGTVIAKNNLVMDATTDYSGTFDAASTDNQGEDGTAPNTNEETCSVTFEDAASDDFHISSADTCVLDKGADLTSDANLEIDFDIDGNTRPAATDIGADEDYSTLYWVGGADDPVEEDPKDWSTSNPTSCNDGKGDSGVVPGAADNAIFDADCDNDADIEEDWTVGDIELQTGYAGEVANKPTAFTTTVDTDDVTVTGGTLNVGIGTIIIKDDLIINGGTFTAPSDTEPAGPAKIEGSFTYTSGTFTDNSGTVMMTGAGASETITSTNEIFNNLTINDGLVLHLKMDETAADSCYGSTNDSCDSSGNKLDFFWQNDTTASSLVPDTFLYENTRSLYFDGTTDYAERDEADALQFDENQDFSIAVWIKPDSIALSYIYTQINSAQSNAGWYLRMSAGGALDFHMQDAGADQATPDFGDNDAGDWTHWIVTVDRDVASGITAYRNGREVDCSSNCVYTLTDVGDLTNTSDPCIGCRNGDDPGGSLFWDGNIEDLRIYNRELTAEEALLLGRGYPGNVGVGVYTLEDALDVDGDLTLMSGELNTNSSEDNTIEIEGNWIDDGGRFRTDGGVVIFDGAGGTSTVKSDEPFFNFTVNDGGGSAHTVDMYSDLDVDNDLTITDGTLDVGSGTVYTIFNAGSWSAGAAGSLTERNGRIVFDGDTSETITTDGEAFYDVFINDGLVGYWPLDETAADTCPIGREIESEVRDFCDYSGFHNHIEDTGTPTFSTTVAPVLFNNPRSVELDGATGTRNESIVPTLANLTSGTISFWANIDLDTGSNDIVAGWGRNNGATITEILISFDMGSDHLFIWAYEDGTLQYEVNTPNDSLDAYIDDWVHVAITHDGTEVNGIYFNGDSQTLSRPTDVDRTPWFKAIFTDAGDPADRFSIGNAWRNGSALSPFDGNIDDFRIYDKELTAQEIRELADGRLNGINTGTYTLEDQLDVDGNIYLGTGELNTNSSEDNTILLAGDWYNYNGVFTTDGGVVRIDGQGGTSYVLQEDGFYNFDVNDGGGSAHTTELYYNLDVDNDLTITDGTLDVGTDDYRIFVGGSWTTETNGTFTERNGEVVFNGTVDETISSNGDDFYDLTINNGLMYYYKFEESAANSCDGGVNDACDSSGYGLDARYVTDPSIVTDAGPTLFSNSRGLDFEDTSSEYMLAPSTNMPTTDFTILAWVNIDDDSGNPVIAMVGDGAGGNELLFYVDSSGGVDGQVDNNNITATSTLVPADTWTHIGMRRDGSDVDLFVNGIQHDADTEADTLDYEGCPLIIGMDNDSSECTDSPSNFFDGTMDELRIYDRALSDGEIQNLAAGWPGNVGIGTYTIEDALDVDGSIYINAGELDTKSSEDNTITVDKNWHNNGGFFTTDGGYVIFNDTSGTHEILGGYYDFYNVRIDGTGGTWNLVSDIWIENDLDIDNGTLDANGYDSITDNDWDIDATLDLGIGTHSINGSVDFTNGTITEDASTLIFNPKTAGETFTSDSEAVNDVVLHTTDGLLGYWKLDETSSDSNSCSGGEDACDSSGNTNHGTQAGTPTVVRDLAPVNFDNVRAWEFDGTDDRVEVLNGDTLTAFSISLWIKTSESGSSGTFWQNPTIFGKSDSGANSGDVAIISTSGNAGFWSGLTAGDESYTGGSTAINDNLWHSLILVNNGETMSLYVDGVDEGTALNTGTALNNEDFWIGGKGGTESPGFYHEGIIDDVRFYDRELTLAEIAALAGGHPMDQDGTLTQSDALDVDGSIVLGDGDWATGNNNINVANDWTNESAAFAAGTGKVDFDDDTVNNTILGSTTFYNLTIDTGTAKNVSFGTTGTTSIAANGFLVLKGAASNILTVQSASGVADWALDLDATACTVIEHLTTTDSDASAGEIIDGDGTGVTADGSNTNWCTSSCTANCIFTYYWVGGNGDSFNTASDWNVTNPSSCNDGGGDAASVPGAGEDVIFDPDCDNDMDIDADWTVGDIELQTGYAGEVAIKPTAFTVTIDTDDVTVTGGTFNVGIGTLDITDDLIINGGTLTAPSSDAPSGYMSIAGSFNYTSGTFTDNGGAVVLDGTGTETIDSNGETFYDLFINSGLIGYWKLDETAADTCEGGANDACDSSGYGNDGSWEGDASDNTDLPTLQFNNPRSVDFDGTGDYIDFGDVADFDFDSSADFSISFWYELDATTLQAFVTKIDGSNAGPGFKIYRLSSGPFVVIIDDGPDTMTPRYNTPSTGSWHHVAVTVDRDVVSGATFYHDGVSQTCTGNCGYDLTTIGDLSSSNSFGFGTRQPQNNGEHLDGRMDDVRVYNRVLTEAEVQILAAGWPGNVGTGDYTIEDTLDVDGNIYINAGELDTKSSEDNTINLAGGWYNYGGQFVTDGGNVVLNGTSGTHEVLAGYHDFYNLQVNGSGGTWNLISDAQITNDFNSDAGTLDGNGYGLITLNDWDIDGIVDLGIGTHLVQGSIDFTNGTITEDTSTVVLNPKTASETVDGDNEDFWNVVLNTTDGLIGWWKLDETTTGSCSGSEDACDSSGNGYHLTDAATPDLSTFLAPVNFNNVRSVYLDDASSEEFTITEDAFRTTEATWCAWFNTDDNTSIQYIFGYGTGGTDRFGLYVNGSALFGAYDDIDDEDDSHSSGITINTYTWYHGCVVINSDGTKNFYVDGVSGTTDSDGSNLSNIATGATFEIGSLTGGANNWNGWIDDARVYNRALSAEEIAALADGLPMDQDGAITQSAAIDIDGDIVLGQGTWLTGGNTMTVAGGWNNESATFTHGSSSVTFDGTSGTHNIYSNIEPFYDFVFNGAGGTWNLQEDVRMDNNLDSDAGTFDANGYSIVTLNDWDIDGTVDLGIGTHMVEGSVDFTNGTITEDTSTTVFNPQTDNETVDGDDEDFGNVILMTTDGMMGFYKLDETALNTCNGGADDFCDSSGNDRHGDETGTVTITTETPTVNFTNARGVEFDGVDDLIDLNSDFIGTGDVTATAWIYPHGYGETSSGRIVSNGAFIFHLSSASSGVLRIASDGVTAVATAAGSMGTFNQWYAVAVTRESDGTANLYIDGSLSGSADQNSGTPVAGTHNAFIGNNNIGSRTFDGVIDDVRIYNRILSAVEIAAIADGLPLDQDGEITQSDAIDIDGNVTLGQGTWTPNNQTMNVAGSWDNTGATFNVGIGTVTFDSVDTGETVTTNGEDFADLVFDSGDGNGAWSLQDALTMDTFTLTDGVLTDNGQTVTLDDTTSADITIADAANILTSTGVWNLNEDGTVTNPNNNTNHISDFTVAATKTATITGTFNIESLILNSTSTLTGGTLRIRTAQNDFIDMQSDSTFSNGVSYIYLTNGSGSTVTQKEFTHTGTTVNYGLNSGTNVTWQMTGDLNVNNLVVRGAGGSTSEATSSKLDMNGNNLTTTGYVELSQDTGSNVFHGKILLGAGTHTIGGELRVDQDTGTTDGYIDFETSTTTINGDWTGVDMDINMGSADIRADQSIDFTSATGVDAGTSQVMLTGGTSETLTSAGSSFYDLFINNGLVYYYKFDESAANSCDGGTNDSCDSSGYGNDAAFITAPDIVSNTAPTVFNNPQALDFEDTSSEYLLVSGSDMPTGNFTIAAWVDIDDDTTAPAVAMISDGAGDNEIILFIQADATLQGIVDTTTMTATTDTVPADTWTHVAMTRSGSTVDLFINGVDSGGGTDGDTLDFSTCDLIIGADNDGGTCTDNINGNFMDGTIDELRIYNRALSTAELQILASGWSGNVGIGTYELEDTLDVDGNIYINAGELDTKSSEDNTITVGESWYNNGGQFTTDGGNVIFDATSGTEEILAGYADFYNLRFDGDGGTWNLVSDVQIANDLDSNTGTFDTNGYDIITLNDWDIHGNLDLGIGTHSIQGTADFTVGTVTPDSSTIVLNPKTAGEQLTAASETFNNLVVSDTDGLVGWWKLDETSLDTCGGGDDACDSSAFGNNGAENGTVTIATDKAPVNFANPRALQFDGSDDRIEVTAASEINDLGPMSFSLWHKPLGDGDNSRSHFISKGQGGLSGWGIEKNTNNRMEFYIDYATTDLFVRTENDVWIDFEWQHIALTWDGTPDASAVKIYRNGSELTYPTQTDPDGARVSDAAINLRIGDSINGVREYEGFIDDVRLYNRVLTPEEVAALAGGHPLDQTGTNTLQDTLDIDGNITIGGGTFAVNGAQTITLAGDWTNRDGTFTPSTGTVDFDDDSQNNTISGDTSFYNLTVSTGTAKTVTFESGSTTTINASGTLTFTGAASQLLTLAPSSTTDWLLTMNGATQNISYVQVSFSDASGGTTIDATDGTNINGGNNINWNFGSTGADAIWFGFNI